MTTLSMTNKLLKTISTPAYCTIKKIFTLYTFCTSILIFLCILFTKSKHKPKSLLIIRPDAIGDYILFRNFLEAIKKNPTYKDYDITLLGNSIWKEVSEKYDVSLVHHFIWIDRKKFIRSFFYKYNFLKKLRAYKYEILLHPVYSRELWLGDFISLTANAHKKIASQGDCTHISRRIKKISNLFYNQLISAKHEILFEFERNREFFQHFLKQNLSVQKPSLPPETPSIENLPFPYAVLFIGASSLIRKWPASEFVKVANYLTDHCHLNIVLCGSFDDIHWVQDFDILFKKPYQNYVGKTTLLELSHIIAHSQLVASNETSAVHFAVAFNKPVAVIYAGIHFTRFAPYPKNIHDNYALALHPTIEMNTEKYILESNQHSPRNSLDIAQIKSESLIERIKKLNL